LQTLSLSAGLSLEMADAMVENAIGILGLPIGIAANFVIDGESALVPMAIEEPSVIAAASHMAKIVGLSGGFHTKIDDSIMIGQIQILDVPDMGLACQKIEHRREELLKIANSFCENMKKRGGGCVDLIPRILPGMLIVHVHVDCCDAMGANIVNTIVEGLAPILSVAVQGRAGFRVLSNLTDLRLARSYCSIPYRLLATDKNGDNGRIVANRTLEGYQFACLDPYRAATHNKGIMNGIDAVAIATGNDWRALEAGAHAYACRSGKYSSLTSYEMDDQLGVLNCAIELPMALGVVGGSTQLHPTIQALFQILGEFGKTAKKLSSLIASVGLAQNLGALRALACEGIQQGHMFLHARKNESNQEQI
jgi:hydroxymethylglutaryl-CoA reductase